MGSKENSGFGVMTSLALVWLTVHFAQPPQYTTGMESRSGNIAVIRMSSATYIRNSEFWEVGQAIQKNVTNKGYRDY